MTTAREVLLDPMVRDRRVLELWPTAPEGDLPLCAAAAREWSVLSPDTPPLPIAGGEVDVVLAASPWWLGGEADRRSAWLAEIQRVLSEEGAVVLDLGPPADRRDLVDPAASSPSSSSSPSPADEVLRGLRAQFGWVAELAEGAFLGGFFLLADNEDMAVAGDLAGLTASTRRRLAVAARRPDPAWQLRESLLIPLPDPRQAERLRALTAECDELRERLMSLDEQNEALDTMLMRLRQASDRQLELLGRSESATELAIAERDRARQRLALAERALHEAEVLLRRRGMDIAALERQVAHLRGAAQTKETARETQENGTPVATSSADP